MHESPGCRCALLRRVGVLRQRSALFVSIIALAPVALLTHCSKPGNSPESDSPPPAPMMFTLGTPETGSLSHAAGLSIARVSEQKLETLGARLTVKPTGGTRDILRAFQSRDLEFAVVRSDELYRAIKGIGEWKEEGRQRDVLAVFTIHDEALTLITTEDSGIRSIQDLRGRNVGIGTEGSSTRQGALLVLKHAELDTESEVHAHAIDPVQGLTSLQDGRLDALFYATFHPDERIRSAATGPRKLRFVSVPPMRLLLLRNPYYVATTIPAGLYPGLANPEAVETIGTKTTLVAATRVPEQIVYALIEGVFDNMEALRALHPANQALSIKTMTDGMYRMIHRGALGYYMRNGFRLSCCF